MPLLFPGFQGTIKIQETSQSRNRGKSGKNIYNLVILVFPPKGRKLRTSVPEIFESAVPKRACQIFRREAFNGNSVTVRFFSMIFTRVICGQPIPLLASIRGQLIASPFYNLLLSLSSLADRLNIYHNHRV